MKNLLALSMIFFLVLTGCKKEEIQPTPKTPTEEYSLEGLWVIEDFPNTAYIFDNGLQYTVYCIDTNCNWDTVTIASAIPNPHPYTFENDTLKVDLGFGNTFSDPLVFVCGGKVVKREFDTGNYGRWYRSSFDITTCSE
jgi:hypothetical protein